MIAGDNSHVWVAIRQQKVLGNNTLDAAPSFLWRRGRVGAVLGQGHAGGLRCSWARRMVAIDAIEGSVGHDGDDGRLCVL